MQILLKFWPLYKLRKFVRRWKQISLVGHFINSHNLCPWWSIDILRWNLMLVTLGSWYFDQLSPIVFWLGNTDFGNLVRLSTWRLDCILTNLCKYDSQNIFIIFIIRQLKVRNTDIHPSWFTPLASCSCLVKIKYFCYHFRTLKIRGLRSVMSSFSKSLVRTVWN